MIEKLGNPIGRSLLTQIEPEKTENTPSAIENREVTKVSNPPQETKVAQTMKGDLALDGFLRRMAVGPGGQMNQPAPIQQTSPPIGSTPSQDVAGTNALKLNSKGPEVERLQYDLNTWRRENNVPEIQTSGVFTEETEQAVKDFQKASSLTETGIWDDSTIRRFNLEQSREYQALDPRIKMEVSSAYAALENDPAGQKNLDNLVRDAKFAYLVSPDTQSSAIAGLMQGASSKDQLEITKMLLLDAAILEKNENFKKLPEETKRAALSTMFYKTGNGGLEVRNGGNTVTDLVTNPDFGKLTPKQQDQFLEIVRANRDTEEPIRLESLMESMNDLSPAVQARAIKIRYESAMNANTTGNWKQDHESFEALDSLLSNPDFKQATEEDQLAQLNGLSGRTGM